MSGIVKFNVFWRGDQNLMQMLESHFDGISLRRVELIGLKLAKLERAQPRSAQILV